MSPRKEHRAAILAELESLKRSDGLIVPADMVEFAKDKTTALHSEFNWNIKEAAYQHWLDQARQLLRVYVTVIPVENKPIRVFASLTTDRVKERGGYRIMVDVMNDKQMRDQMLQDAFVQFENMQRKYQSLQELAEVWQAVSKAKRRKRQAA